MFERRRGSLSGRSGGAAAGALLGDPRLTEAVAWAIIATVAIIDLISGPDVRTPVLFVIPPLIVALRCSEAVTVRIAVASLIATIAVGIWNEDVTVNQALRVLGIALAGRLAIAVTRLREQLELERGRALLLADAAGLLEATLDRDATASGIAELAVPKLAGAASVDIVVDEGERIRSAAIVAAEPDVRRRLEQLRLRHPIEPGSAHPVARVIDQGATVHMSDVDDDTLRGVAADEAHLESLRAFAPRASLVVPLRARGRTRGAMTLFRFDDGTFDGEAIELAEQLGRRAAQALDNALRHEGQAHIAGVLQRSIHPESPPQIPGLDIAARYRPVGEQNEVGGDFYDVFELGDGSVAAVIGDVSGKGAEAAAITALARHTLRSESARMLGPAEALRHLNVTLCRELGDGRFCTVAYTRLRFDPARPGVGVAVALGGHPQPLAIRSNRAIEAIGRPGTLLGAFERPRIHEVSTRIEPGESLVFYTDGMLEARGDARGGSEALAADLAGAAGQAPSLIARRLERGSIERQAGRPRDDIAVLVIRAHSSRWAAIRLARDARRGGLTQGSPLSPG